MYVIFAELLVLVIIQTDRYEFRNWVLLLNWVSGAQSFSSAFMATLGQAGIPFSNGRVRNLLIALAFL